MNSDPDGLSRFDHLRPGHDFVVFDPEGQEFRELTPGETARFLDAIRLPAERADELPDPGSGDAPERDLADQAEEPQTVGDEQEAAVAGPEFRPSADAAPSLDLDAAERAYREERGLDQPGRISAALEPERSEPQAEVDDEERER